MKKCPACGVLNKPENSACYSCFGSLADAEIVTAQTPPQQPPSPGTTGSRSFLGAQQLGEGDQTSEPVSEVGQPLGGYQQQRPQAGPYGPPPARPRVGPGAPPQHMQFTKPVGTTNVLQFFSSLLTVAVVLGLGYYLVNRLYLTPQKPLHSVRTFIESVQLRDEPVVRATLSRNSQWILQAAPTYLFVFRSQEQGFEYEKQFKLKLKEIDKDSAIVVVSPGLTPNEEFKPETLPANMRDGYPFTVVLEDGEWKVDLTATLTSIMGPQFQAFARKYTK